MTPPRRARARIARLLHWLLIVVAVLLGVAVLGLGAFRLYYNDARLRPLVAATLSSTLHAPVELEGFDSSLWGDVVLEGLTIGAPDGFSEPVARIDRLALRWSLWRLLLWTVRIDEVALEGANLCLEENAAGTSLAAMFPAPPAPASRPTPTKKPSAPPAAPPATTPLHLTQPLLPIRIQLEDLHLRDLVLRYVGPEMSVELRGLGVEGSFRGFWRESHLELWAGLGAHDDVTRTSTLTVRRRGVDEPLVVTQRLDVALDSDGLGASKLKTRWHASTTGVAPKAPPLETSLALDASAALLAPEDVALQDLTFSIGEGTRLHARLKARDPFAAPEVELEALELASKLDELAPLVAALVPGTSVRGVVGVDIAPFALRLVPGEEVRLPATELRLALEDVGWRLTGLRGDGLNVTTTLHSEADAIRLDTEVKLAAVEAAGAKVRGLATALRAELAPAALVGGLPPADAKATAHLEVQLASLEHPALTAGGIHTAVDVVAPLALALGGEPTEPLTLGVTTQVARIVAGPAQATRLALAIGAEVDDLQADHARLKVTGSLAGLQLSEPSIDLSPLRWRLVAAREGELITLDALEAHVADLVAVTADAKVGAFLSPAPVIERLRLDVLPVAIGRALALLPPEMRPPLSVDGQVALAVDAAGTVPYGELLTWAVPPAVSPEAPFEAQFDAMWSYVDAWRRAFARTLPFSAGMSATLTDLALEQEATRIDGGAATVALRLTPQGPRAELGFEAKAIDTAGKVADVKTRAALSFDVHAIRATADATLGSLAHDALATPLQSGEGHFDLTYDFASDRLTEHLTAALPEPHLVLAVEGQLDTLVRSVRSRAWKAPKLGGMSARLATSLSASAATPTLLTATGLTLDGDIGLKNELTLKDGLLALVGDLDAKAFSATQADAGLERLSGELPWNIELAFGKRTDGFALSRELEVGGGTLALVTEATDVRQRADRPIYYERLRPYREQHGLTAARIYSGPYAIEDLELDARLERGMVLVDWLALKVIGGDVIGNAAIQIGADGALRGNLAFKTSNLDASNFAALDLPPGSSSELSASAQVGFELAPHRRDLTLNANITKIGAQTFDRFLQALDPEGKDKKLQEQRGNLVWFRTGLVRLDEVAVWVRYDALNVDLIATTFLRVPGTNVGYMPIPRELLRRYPLGEMLDVQLQPIIDTQLAPLLGWNHAS